MEGQWRGLRIVIRATVHTEYIELTVILDLFIPPTGSEQNPIRPDIEREFLNLRKGLDDALKERNTTGLGHKTPAIVAFFNRKLATPHKFLYRDIWEAVGYDLADAFSIDFADKSEREFADFRGIILDGNGGEHIGTDQGIRLPFDISKYHPDTTVNRRGFDGDKPERLVNWLLPLLVGPHDVHHQPELACSQFLTDQIIYCSTLGAHFEFKESGADPPEPSASALTDTKQAREPLTYIMVCHSPLPWQTGRFVDMIHHLGTIRLAALFDLPFLVSASESIKNLGADFSSEDSIGGSLAIKKLNELLKIAKLVPFSPGRPKMPGLPYRVERSAQYVKEFNFILDKSMHDREIPGFQRYTDFVHRGMVPTYDFISRINVRYERLQSRIRLVIDAARTESMHTIQVAGEFLLFFVVLPTYFYDLTTHLHPFAFTTRFHLLAPPPSILDNASLRDQIRLVVVFALSIVLFCFRRVVKKILRDRLW